VRPTMSATGRMLPWSRTPGLDSSTREYAWNSRGGHNARAELREFAANLRFDVVSKFRSGFGRFRGSHNPECRT